MASSSSACYYVLGIVTIPEIEIECTITYLDRENVTANRVLPLFVGTVLKKEGDRYGIVQDLYGGDKPTKLKSVVIDEYNVKQLQSIDIDKHKEEIRVAGVIINLMYTGLSTSDPKTFFATPGFFEGIKSLETYVQTWGQEKPDGSKCAIAGGRRRPKKSRRSRSTRKRRQTRSK
jgi:hypothetical protein